MKNNDIKEKPEQLNYKNHHIEKIWNSFIVDFSCVWNLWPWFLAVLGGPSISQCLLHLDFLLLFCYTPFFSPTQFINWSRSYTNSFYTPFHYIAIYCDRINWLSSLKLDIYELRDFNFNFLNAIWIFCIHCTIGQKFCLNRQILDLYITIDVSPIFICLLPETDRQKMHTYI